VSEVEVVLTDDEADEEAEVFVDAVCEEVVELVVLPEIKTYPAAAAIIRIMTTTTTATVLEID